MGREVKQRVPSKCNSRYNQIAIFLILLVCYIYFLPRWADWNQNSRFDLVLSIVDEHTLSIDSYYMNTGDYALYDGHYYSDKAPGMSFLAVPVYAAFRSIASVPSVAAVLERVAASPAFGETLRAEGSGLLADKVRFAAALTLATWVVVSLPSALAGMLLYSLLGSLFVSEFRKVLVTLGYGLGTNAFPYAGSFYSHQLVAALLFFAFYLIFQRRGQAMSAKRLLLIGLLLGYAVITEYPTALIAGALFLYAGFLLRDRRGFGYVILGCLPPVVLLAAYDLAAFGTALPAGYAHSALWTQPHHTGFMSLTYPKWDALWGLTFSPYRGLFFLSPFALLGAIGFVPFFREKDFRAESLVCLFAVVSFLLFNASSVMWWGGFAVGPRYMVPALPFLAVPAAFLLKSMPERRIWGVLLAMLVSISILTVGAVSIAGQNYPPEAFHFPLRDIAMPSLAAGDVARNLGMVFHLPAWQSLLPLVAVITLLLVMLHGLSRRTYTLPPKEESYVHV